MSPVVSKSPININARKARWRKVRGMMGKRKETSFPLPPSHRPLFTSAVIVFRDHSLTAYVQNNKRRLGRVSGQIKLEPHPGTVFLIREFLPREFTFLRLQLSTEIFSSSFLTKTKQLSSLEISTVTVYSLLFTSQYHLGWVELKQLIGRRCWLLLQLKC